MTATTTQTAARYALDALDKAAVRKDAGDLEGALLWTAQAIRHLAAELDMKEVQNMAAEVGGLAR